MRADTTFIAYLDERVIIEQPNAITQIDLRNISNEYNAKLIDSKFITEKVYEGLFDNPKEHHTIEYRFVRSR